MVCVYSIHLRAISTSKIRIAVDGEVLIFEIYTYALYSSFYIDYIQHVYVGGGLLHKSIKYDYP